MIYVTDIFIVGFTYLFMTTFENALHKASHYKESGRLYRWHKIHHTDYPVTRLESDTYIDSSGWYDNMFGVYIILTIGVFCMSSSTNRVATIVSSEIIAYSLMLDYFHQQFHLTNSRFKHYKWFQKLKRYHLLHHKKQKMNYNFFTNKVDKLGNSYLSDKERFKIVASNS